MWITLVAAVTSLTLYPLVWLVFIGRGKRPRVNSAVSGAIFEAPIMAWYVLEPPTVKSLAALTVAVSTFMCFSLLRRFDRLSFLGLWILLALQALAVAFIF